MENIYIETLKHGVATLQSGTTYNQVKEYLSSIGLPINENFEEYYIRWFFTTFYVETFSYLLEHDKYGSMDKIKLLEGAGKKAILTGGAYQNYLDYLELHEAHENSIQAQEAANESIRIARLTLWISAGISILSMLVNFLLL